MNIGDNANSETTKTPAMFILPYIKNDLKHGFSHKKGNTIGREKTKTFNKKIQAQHKQFVLKATVERLNLLNYGKQQGVDTIDLKENNLVVETKVILKTPILNSVWSETQQY